LKLSQQLPDVQAFGAHSGTAAQLPDDDEASLHFVVLSHATAVIQSVHKRFDVPHDVDEPEQCFICCRTESVPPQLDVDEHLYSVL